MRPGLSFCGFGAPERRPVGRGISSERRFTECGAGLSSQPMRPMTGFAEQSNLASRSHNAGLHRRKCSSRSPMARRCRPAKRMPLLGPGRCSIAIPIATSRRTLPDCVSSAEYFPLLRGSRRFRGEGSATPWPRKSPVLSQAIYRCRGFAACLPQADKILRIAVKCLIAGPDRSAMRKRPAHCPHLAAPNRRTLRR
jgi:hypothetical protein